MTSKETKKRLADQQKDAPFGDYYLLLHNDDVHSFDFVIDALMEICEHDYEQAVQCTMITHHKGRCDIRKGTFESLKIMKSELIKIGLNATIESSQ